MNDNLINMRSDLQLMNTLPGANGMLEMAKEKGLDAFFFYIKSGEAGVDNDSRQDGYYFVVCRDEKCAREMRDFLYLKRDECYKLLQGIDVERDVINTRYAILPLKYLDETNKFQAATRCIRNIYDMEAAKAAYTQYGYEPPTWIARSTLQAIYTFIEKRYNQDAPQFLRESEEEAFHKFIDRSVKNYAKDKPIRHRVLRPHEVHRDYFFINHIPVINTTVTDGMWRYFKSRWDECPDFYCYRESQPFESYKDKRKLPAKLLDVFPMLEDYWANLIGYRKYRMAYPSKYENLVNSWAVDYFAEKCKWKFVVPFEKLDKTTGPLHRIEIDGFDLSNWASLCTANNVNCALNHGEMGSVGGLGSVVFIYQDKDDEMVRAIQNRLIRDMQARTVVIVPEAMRQKSEKGIEQMDKKAAEAAEKKAKRAERWKKLDSVVKLGIETREEEEKPDPNDHIVEQGRGYESGWDDIDV